MILLVKYGSTSLSLDSKVAKSSDTFQMNSPFIHIKVEEKHTQVAIHSSSLGFIKTGVFSGGEKCNLRYLQALLGVISSHTVN